jgi:hypothetical protein
MAGPGKPGRGKGHPKTGGRQKGAVDKIKREAILAAQGITPLDYMLGIVRNEQEDKTVRSTRQRRQLPTSMLDCRQRRLRAILRSR